MNINANAGANQSATASGHAGSPNHTWLIRKNLLRRTGASTHGMVPSKGPRSYSAPPELLELLTSLRNLRHQSHDPFERYIYSIAAVRVRRAVARHKYIHQLEHSLKHGRGLQRQKSPTLYFRQPLVEPHSVKQFEYPIPYDFQTACSGTPP